MQDEIKEKEKLLISKIETFLKLPNQQKEIKENKDLILKKLKLIEHEQRKINQALLKKLEKNVLFIGPQTALNLLEIREEKTFKNVKLRNFKFHNLQHPAININFQKLHKYELKKEVHIEEFIIQIQKEIQKIERELKKQKGILNTHQEKQIKLEKEVQALDLEEKLIQFKQLIEQIELSPNEFEFCLSNYHRNFMYYNFSFKFIKLNKEHYSSTNHLAERQINIICIDLQEKRNRNKIIDKSLEQFKKFEALTTLDFYIKKRS